MDPTDFFNSTLAPPAPADPTDFFNQSLTPQADDLSALDRGREKQYHEEFQRHERTADIASEELKNYAADAIHQFPVPGYRPSDAFRARLAKEVPGLAPEQVERAGAAFDAQAPDAWRAKLFRDEFEKQSRSRLLDPTGPSLGRRIAREAGRLTPFVPTGIAQNMTLGAALGRMREGKETSEDRTTVARHLIDVRDEEGEGPATTAWKTLSGIPAAVLELGAAGEAVPAKYYGALGLTAAQGLALAPSKIAAGMVPGVGLDEKGNPAVGPEKSYWKEAGKGVASGLIEAGAMHAVGAVGKSLRGTSGAAPGFLERAGVYGVPEMVAQARASELTQHAVGLTDSAGVLGELTSGDPVRVKKATAQVGGEAVAALVLGGLGKLAPHAATAAAELKKAGEKVDPAVLKEAVDATAAEVAPPRPQNPPALPADQGAQTAPPAAPQGAPEPGVGRGAADRGVADANLAAQPAAPGPRPETAGQPVGAPAPQPAAGGPGVLKEHPAYAGIPDQDLKDFAASMMQEKGKKKPVFKTRKGAIAALEKKWGASAPLMTQQIFEQSEPPPTAPATAPPTQGTGHELENLKSLGTGVGASMRDAMYKKYQAGDTTEAGAPSVLLQVARMVGPGLSLEDFKSVIAEADAARQGQAGPEYQQALKDVVGRWKAKTAQEAPQAPPAAPEAQKAPEAAPGEKTQPERSQAAPQAAPQVADPKGLLDRIDRGEGGLTAEEKAVLTERLLWATSYREMAESIGKSYQTVANIEARALKKLGHEGTVDELHLRGRGAQAVAEVEEGRNVRGVQDLHERGAGEAQHNVRINQIGDAVEQMDALWKRQKKEKTRGNLSPEREAHYRAEFERLRGVIDQGATETVPAPGQQGAGEGAPAAERPAGAVAPGGAASTPGAGTPESGSAPAGGPGGGATRGGVAGQHPNIAAGKPFAMGAAAMGELTPATPGAEPASPTALANARIDKERAAEGLNPIIGSARMDNPEAWDAAQRRLDADPGLGHRLVEDVTNKARPLDAVEQAVLLREKIRLDNEARVLGRQLREAQGPQGNLDAQDLDALQKNVDDLHRQRYELALAAKRTGSELGRSLAFRRQLAAEDYSLQGMLDEAVAAKGRPLTAEEHERITQLQEKITGLQKQLAAAEDAGQPPLDKSGNPSKGRSDLGRAQGEFRQEINSDRLKNRSTYRKVLDTLVKLRVNEVISAPVTLAKIINAGLTRIVSTPLEQLAGVPLSRIPGLAKIAALAPREGPNPRGVLRSAAIEAHAFYSGLTDGFRDLWQTIRTGRSALDVANKPDWMPREWLDYQFSLHDAMKAPAVRMEYTRSFLQRIDHGAARGEDVSSPAGLLRVAAEAYKDAQAAKFRQDNGFAKWVNDSLELKPKDAAGIMAAKTAAKVVVAPVVKIPANIVYETGNYLFGTGLGSVRALRAWKNGFDSLKPAEADAIMRNFKKGSLGLGLLALGFLRPQMFGGYYEEGEKKKPGEPGFGEARVGDATIPKYLMHHPLLQVPQFAATVRRAYDKTAGQGKGEAATEGALAGVMGLGEELPMARGTKDVGAAFSARQRGGFFGELAKSLAVPQLVQWLAGVTDRDAAGAVRRKAKGFWQHFETGVPGLRERVPAR